MTTAFGDGSDNPASGGGQHTVSGQRRGEKGVRERDSEWYSGGDPEGSSGDILCSGDTAVTDSGGGLMVGTGGMCNGCTEMAGSNSSLGSGTGGVQWMRNSSWGPAGRGDIAVGDAQWDAVGDGISGSSNAGGSGSGNGRDIAGGGSEGPMTPEPDRVKESARAARARARAAMGGKHVAELRGLEWLDQQVEQALSSPTHSHRHRQ